jgi:deoxyribonuclease IV
VDLSQDKRRIGPHLPLGGGLVRAVERAEAIGATAVQIFTDNPTAWRRRREPPAELAEFRDRLARADMWPIAVHAPYVVNLCGPNPEFWQRSVETMTNELRVAATYRAAFVVMHIGSHKGIGRDEGIRRLVDGLGRILAATDGAGDDEPTPAPRLVLENSAGMGDGIGSSLADLCDIMSEAARASLPSSRIGVCLDTAHLWGAGYDISSAAGVADLAAQVEQRLGRESVVMLHLNDSRTTLGSRLDRHEHIAAGRIGAPGMRAILGHPWLGQLPTYLETPGMDSGYDLINLQRVRELIAGAEPPPLPAEAFALRGSRARSAPPAD